MSEVEYDKTWNNLDWSAYEGGYGDVTKKEFKQAIKKLLVEARINENEIMQHQAFNILKSAKAVGQWSEIRVTQLKKEV